MSHPFTRSQMIFKDEIQSQLADRNMLIDKVLLRLREAGCDPHPFFDRLCLDEAISNAMIHGNQQDPSKQVEVRVFCSPSLWGVEIIDQGAGFDWRTELSRLKGDHDLSSPSGRGLALIVSSGADVMFLDGGRRLLFMRKRSAALGSTP